MAKTIIVASHRRSGTHLTIDALVNNFPSFRAAPDTAAVTLDHLSAYHQFRLTPAELERRISRGPAVLKTHAHARLGDFFGGDKALGDYVRDLFGSSRMIYVVRDGRDVLVSLYHYENHLHGLEQGPVFSAYLRGLNTFDFQTYDGDMSRVAYWGFHVNSWLERGNLLAVSFEALRRDYRETLRTIADFIEEPLATEIRDIRRTAASNRPLARLKRRLKRQLGHERYSSVYFRRGTPGEWPQMFSKDDLGYFDQISGAVNRRLGYQ